MFLICSIYVPLSTGIFYVDSVSRCAAIDGNRLAYRKGHFVVAGYSYSHCDTLDQNNNGSCDYNLLAGKLTKNGNTSKADVKTVNIEDWNDDIGLGVCGFNTAE